MPIGDIGEDVERRFAEAVLALGKTRGLSQKEIAAAAKLDRTHLHRTSRGERGLTLAAAVRMSDAVKGKLVDLLAGIVPDRPEESPVAIDALRRIAKEAIDALYVIDRRSTPGASSATAPAGGSGVSSRGGEVVDFSARSNIDGFFDLHTTDVPVIHYIAAGEGREAMPEETGEVVAVSNNVYREAERGGWKIVKVVGDSMADRFVEGDFVYIQPVHDWAKLQDGDVVACVHRGEQLLKTLRFTRGRDGRPTRIRLESLNRRYKPIRIAADDDFRVVGLEMTVIKKPRRGRG